MCVHVKHFLFVLYTFCICRIHCTYFLQCCIVICNMLNTVESALTFSTCTVYKKALVPRCVLFRGSTVLTFTCI